MARFLVNEISLPGQTVLDPFCGSGSVLIESILQGRNAIGIDLNPLATTLATAKTAKLNQNKLSQQLSVFTRELSPARNSFNYNFPNAHLWFTEFTLVRLGILRNVLTEFLPLIPSDYACFWKSLAYSIVRACSNADTRGPKPFISKRARINRVGKNFDPFEIFLSKARSWIEIESQFFKSLDVTGEASNVRVIEGDSRNLSRMINPADIDVVITSPPYLSAQDYYRASKLQLFVFDSSNNDQLTKWSRDLVGSDRILRNDSLLELQLVSRTAESYRDKLKEKDRRRAQIFAKYVLDMKDVIHELSKSLKNRARLGIVSSYNLSAGILIPTYEIIQELAIGAGFRLTARYSDKIRDRWVPIRRNGHNGVILEEYLLLFEKFEKRQ